MKDDKIGPGYVSESFLSKCVERKGYCDKGWVKLYRNQDPDVTPPGKGWAVFGKKEVQSKINAKFVGLSLIINRGTVDLLHSSTPGHSSKLN